MDLALAAVALVAGFFGYFIRRWEHHREQRLDAYRSVLGAFLEAAITGADLLSVHIQIGFPDDLNRQTRSREEIDAMSTTHHDTWVAARNARYQFETAAFGVELVAKQQALDMVDHLREFLQDALYSGVPWRRRFPDAKLSPVDIVTASLDLARPHVRKLARELWGRRIPEEHMLGTEAIKR